ncbi:ribulose-phosphate 3-epimerase [Mycoplasmatota bacterium zrk1]
MILAPSVLAADKENIEKEIQELEAYDVKWLHLDVMDGLFVPAKTFGPDFVKKIRNMTSMFFDVHLMIEKPIDYINHWVDAGADLITFHFEAGNDPMKVIERIKSFGVKAGISIKPNTKVDEIRDLLPFVDLVLVMSVEPGKGGQKFISNSLEKIKKLSGGDYLIEVDGGINESTGKQCIDAGADVLVAGTYVFKHKNNINILNKL